MIDLPEPCIWTDWTDLYSLNQLQARPALLKKSEGLFSADQMREYAAAAASAAIPQGHVVVPKQFVQRAAELAQAVYRSAGLEPPASTFIRND